jgi:hypothetical protein
MPEMPREVIEHKLGIVLALKPITSERRETIQVEVNKLFKVGFIRLIDYPSWLGNPVLVRKPDGFSCMCINYTSLNKACPKDEYSLPRTCQIMDSTVTCELLSFQYSLPRTCQIMDSTATCELLSFLDVYSGYHQISLTTDDEEKTSFIMPFGIFCYTKMTFELKNGGATYQKCVHIVLEN